MPIQSQGIATRENVSVDISAVARFRVVDAVESVVAIENGQKVIAAGDESLAAALGDASDTMMAHPLQHRNLQPLAELGVDKITTVVFRAPLMSTISELGPTASSSWSRMS